MERRDNSNWNGAAGSRLRISCLIPEALASRAFDGDGFALHVINPYLHGSLVLLGFRDGERHPVESRHDMDRQLAAQHLVVKVGVQIGQDGEPGF
jgi:hypothetical protein